MTYFWGEVIVEVNNLKISVNKELKLIIHNFKYYIIKIVVYIFYTVN